MVFAGERCLKFHRRMLIVIGLWPYQRPFILKLQALFFFTAYCSTIFFQFTAFLTTACNMDCILKRVCYICICFVYVLNHYCFYFNSEIIKQLTEYMQLEWKLFENSNAMKIFEEYLMESYILALSTLISTIIGGLVFVSIECKPVVLDVLMPLNESRPRVLEIEFESFLDKQQYFFVYFLQEILGVGIGICSIVATATFFVTLIKHFCATYKIASCLMQNTVTVYTLQLPASQRKQFMYQSIRCSVHIHRRTIQFLTGLLLSIDMWYFPLLLIAVVSLSCLLFRLYLAVTQFHGFYDIFISSIILYFCLTYMFVGNFLAQSCTDHSIGILESMYNGLWYVAPLPIQKLVLILQTSVKRQKIVLGGLFVASIEGFATLMTTGVSYFTVIHAMH